MTITLTPDSSFILQLMLTHDGGANEADLVRALEQAGFRHVALLENESALVGQVRAQGRVPSRVPTHVRARTVSKPVRLEHTKKSQWLGVWPVSFDIHDSASVLQAPVTLEAGETYDIRFITSRSSRAHIHVLLRQLGFRVLEGPVVLRRHVHYPGLRGELVDAVARVTWMGKATVWKSGDGPVLFEDIKSLKA